MTYNDVKELIGIIDNSKFTNFELVIDNVSVKMSKNNNEFSNDKNLLPITNQQHLKNIIPVTEVKENININEEIEEIEKEIEQENKKEVAGNIVKSPIVGTFYSSTSPGKPPIVSKGDKVSKGDVLCIVEAMKVMNEIISDFDGEIEEIFVENGQLVEYGEPLFSII